MDNKEPKVPADTFVAPDATLIGNVQVANKASIWYNCVLDAQRLIRIGAYTNIQDDTIITEASEPLSVDHDGSTIVGNHVTIGHKCVLKGCTIESYCVVGMGSVLNEGSYMESESILGAGSVLMANARVPKHTLWAGNPAKYIRQITEEELEDIRRQSIKYWKTAEEHALEYYLPNNFAYVSAERQGITVGYQVEGITGHLV